jgi:hypothetical protein
MKRPRRRLAVRRVLSELGPMDHGSIPQLRRDVCVVTGRGWPLWLSIGGDLAPGWG